MLEFKSLSKFHITGIGEVIVVKSQSDKSIVGEVVKIDGEEYNVRGIEVQGYLREGKDIGLLITKISAKEIKTEKCTTYTPTTDTSDRCLICGKLKYEHE